MFFNTSHKPIDYCGLIKKGAKLVDVRSEKEFQNGSLPGAINIPVGDINTAYKQIDEQDTIIVYCVTGARSSSAKFALESMGFENVVDMGSFRNYNCD